MKILTATLMAHAILTATVFGQSATQDQPARRDASRGAGSNERYAAENLDYQIAACLLLGNQEEIALAQLGEKHATHPQVKELAQMLVEHHTKAVALIQKAAPEVASLQLAAKAGQPSNEPGGRSVAMLQRIKSECLSLTQKELEQHQGTEFDKAFVGQQIGAHLGMLAQLRGSKSFASPELQKVIAQGEQMTTTHMAEAKKIMNQIKDETNKTADATRRSAATKR